MGGKKKCIEMFGSFMEPFNCSPLLQFNRGHWSSEHIQKFYTVSFASEMYTIMVVRKV